MEKFQECWVTDVGKILWKKKLNKCISQGLTQVATWYHRTSRPKFTKFGK